MRLHQRVVNIGVAQKMRGQSQAASSEKRSPRQPKTQEPRASNSYSSDMPRRSDSTDRSFQLAAERGNEFPSSNEIPLPSAAVQAELGNTDMITTLCRSISQLASSLSFIRDVSTNQVGNSSNSQK